MREDRAFYLAAVVLVLGALLLHFVAISRISRGVQYRARSVTVSEEQRPETRAEADRSLRRGQVLFGSGLGLAVTSVICVLVSFRRHEPAPRSLPIVLLLCYFAIITFVLV